MTEGPGDVNGRLPDFLLIGAPRSGTTSLSKYLAAHPGVFVAAKKELNFFDRREPSPEALARYRRHFAPAAPGQVVGEATPTYLHSPHAAPRMAAVVPDARLVAILRHPVDRAYSHYWWRRLWRAESREFSDAVEEELAGRAPDGAEYLGHGMYHQHLVRLCRHYPRSSLLVVLLDDLVADPANVFKAVCTHIGADADVHPAIVGARINTTSDVRSLRIWRSMERWRGRPERRFALARLIDSWNAYPFEPPPIDPATAERLASVFSGPNAELSAWLGRSLNRWS